jgi:hypothetical protein
MADDRAALVSAAPAANETEAVLGDIAVVPDLAIG